MKTINKTIILLSLLLFLTACTSTPEKALQHNFKQGYGNLIITTIENAPPETIYPNSNFKINVKLENQGAYDLINGKIKILGFDEKYIFLEKIEKEIISSEGENFLQGKNVFNPSGDLAFIEFEAQSRDVFPGAESYNANYFIKTEYDYKTELTQTVCLNPKTYEVYDSGCKVEPKISLNGQGSPLAITQLEEIIYSGSNPQVEFRFFLGNKGKGRIKQVHLDQAKLADKSLECEFQNNPGPNKNTFDFKEEQEVTLICKKMLEKQKSYETTLFLDLSFTYSLQEKKKITLQK